jgi:hypothetical protein
MKTTAELRNEAYEAASACRWEEAANLYEQAIAAYPKHDAGSQLAINDKAKLQERATSCSNMAQQCVAV